MSIPVEFLKNVPADKKADVEAAIRGSTTLLLSLRKILSERLHSVNADEARSTDYDSPAWPFKQANRNGKHSAYQEILSLITFKATE